MPLFRIRSVWSGATGLPGISTFYTSSIPTALEMTAIHDFWGAIAAFLPDVVDIQVQTTGDVLDSATGVLTGGWDVSVSVPMVHGTGLGAYAANAGIVIGWTTGTVVKGRRLKGRTFLVPGAPSCFTSSGTPSTETVQIKTAAETMAQAFTGSLCVWHRPKSGSGGSSAAVEGVYIGSSTAQLKSRRD